MRLIESLVLRLPASECWRAMWRGWVRIILELKAVSSLNAAHERQLVSYMNSTGIKEGMLLNFGNVRRLEWRVNSP